MKRLSSRSLLTSSLLLFLEEDSSANRSKGVKLGRRIGGVHLSAVLCAGSFFMAFLLPGTRGIGQVIDEAWVSIGPEGGRVQALAIDPSNSRIIYAGTEGAGLLKSTNGGKLWISLNTINAGNPVLRPAEIGAIAIDRSNTNI